MPEEESAVCWTRTQQTESIYRLADCCGWRRSAFLHPRHLDGLGRLMVAYCLLHMISLYPIIRAQFVYKRAVTSGLYNILYTAAHSFNKRYGDSSTPMINLIYSRVQRFVVRWTETVQNGLRETTLFYVKYPQRRGVGLMDTAWPSQHCAPFWCTCYLVNTEYRGFLGISFPSKNEIFPVLKGYFWAFFAYSRNEISEHSSRGLLDCDAM